MSHDLRSPLVNLQGFSNELNLGCDEFRGAGQRATGHGGRERCLTLLDGDMAEAIHFIQSGVRRLATIIDLLSACAGRVEYQWQEVNVAEIVAHIVDAMNDTIRQRGARLNILPLPPVLGDPAGDRTTVCQFDRQCLELSRPAAVRRD